MDKNTKGEPSRREHILNEASDAMSRFLYYDRKECEDLPMGSIEEAIKAGEITVDEILAVFRENIESVLK